MIVIFDCDGVLIDSEYIAAKLDSELFAEVGLVLTPLEVAARFAGLTAEEIYASVEDEIGRAIPDDMVQRSETELDVRLAREVEAIGGVHDMLDRLDFARCVCSNSPGSRLETTLTRTGLWDRFRPYVYSAREVREGRGKPAPDVFLHAAQELETPVAEVIVVEDSTHGVAGAVAAGMRVIGFTGGRHSWPGHAEVLMDAGALTVVRRHADIPQTVDALASWTEPA